MPASSTPSGRPGQHPSRQPAIEPRGALQETLEHDGISWEGSILIVGQDGDIPAWLTVTAERIVLSRGEAILLEAPRSWLVPAPLRVHDQQVRISITPEGVVPGRDTTERLLIDIQRGRGPAQQLIAILTGRSRRDQLNAEFPTWSNGVGAGPTLPPLPAFESTQDTEPPKPSAEATPIDAWGADTPDPQSARPAIPFRAPEEEPLAPQSHAARYLASREHGPALPAREEPATEGEQRPAKVVSIEEERGRRGAGWGIWTGRIAMALIVALVGSWFARDYLPAEVTERLPAFVDVDRDVALEEGDEAPPSSNARNGDGTLGADADPEDIMPTEAALGLGGSTSEVPDPELETKADGPQPTPTQAPQSEPAQESAPGDAASGSFPPDGTGNTVPPQAPDDTGNGTGGNDAGESVVVPTEAPVVPTEVAVQPTQAPVVPTEVPVEPTDVPIQPTEVPVEPTRAPVEPTEVPAEPTQALTEAPEPTAAPTEAPEPTVVPTETPAPTGEPEPTTAPETQAPTSAPTEAPEPTAAATEPALESQPASVTESEPPTQQFETAGIRYSVEGAATGTSLPELPQVNEVTYGEWVVLAVEGENWTTSEQVFDMREFTLIADGEPIQLDAGNSWVASLLDYMPAYGNTDATLWAPGESHPFVLTFLAPRDAESLVLQAGEQQFDLRTIIEQTPSLAELRQDERPKAIEATVAEVIDGETIVVEKDGVQQTVRYLGIDAPGEGDCNADASAQLNRELVEGRTVRIERQATDVDAQGNWVRDVWVEQEDGRFALVAHQLVEQGAAKADISEPNTRFASWLRGAEAVAQAEGRGLWGACEQGSAPAPVTGELAVTIDGWRNDRAV